MGRHRIGGTRGLALKIVYGSPADFPCQDLRKQGRHAFQCDRDDHVLELL